MLIAVGSLAVMGLALGGLLGTAARYLAVEENPVEGQLKEMLPGSQCGQCGYVGCGQAAAALATGQAPVHCARRAARRWPKRSPPDSASRWISPH